LASVVPTLRNGGIAAGGRTITWHLRRDARWQDGVPFTSRDVKFTVEAILNPKNNVPLRRRFDLVRDVRTPDPYTVVLRLRKPFAPAVTRKSSFASCPTKTARSHSCGRTKPTRSS
jgi:peptide/nickel transport system substrate-binding protein